jgi:hypothetical protein
MTRAEQNTLILNSITKDLRDKPNIQTIITSKFNSWFRELVAQGQQLLAQGAPAPSGDAEQGAAPAEGGAPPPEGASA